MPWTVLVKDEANNIRVEGPLGDILRTMAKYMRFDYQVIQPPDGYWGIALPNGSWTGMIGMVRDGVADFALGPFIISHERNAVVDFTRTLYFDGVSILTQRPTIKSDVQGLVNVFSYEVWILIFSSIVAIVLAMLFIEKVEGKLRDNPATKSFARSLMWPVQTLALETSEWLPKGNAGRVLATTWLFATLIITSCYSGILTAMLTAPKVTIPIDSLEDLVTQTEVPWKLLSGSFLLSFLKESTDVYRQKAFYGSSGTIPDCWDGREAIARGEYAALCGENTAKKCISWDYSTTGRCHLYIARTMVVNYGLSNGLIFPKNSSYLEGANRIQTVTNTSQCMRPPTADRSEGVAPLNIEAFGGSFIIVGFG
ncbi:glutamate receptor ionotropic, kainate glr-3-like [Macrobrachium nipponense]|uniref:glutamate receptor ionotropic, kainate glr-3-like n=1 Tax=Macrobrachium nipponense TaxID=159736 RepID=UPI0030C7FA4A